MNPHAFSRFRYVTMAFGALVAMHCTAALGGNLQVVSVTPARHTGTALPNSPIAIEFDLPLNPATVSASSFRVFGPVTGPVSGVFSYSPDGRTVTFNHARLFAAGDVITVTLGRQIEAADGSPLRSAGYHYQFMVNVKPTKRTYTLAQQFSVDDDGGFARIYGGQASDLDGDGWPDLTMVCENSSDLRVYLNHADGSATFGPRLIPSIAVGGVPSPNKAADFNNDGKIDICTGNFDGTVTVVFGNGDGTFANRQDFTIGNVARGIVAVDIDGDADTDIVCATPGSNSLARLMNNGSGVFTGPFLFDGGGNAEYGLDAADMTEDGILDLVVGHENSNSVAVLRGIGDGTFVTNGVRGVAGGVWVVVCGDVNGDGHIDITSANSFNGSFSVVRGNGDGTLQPAVNYNGPGHVPAVDLADADGDGDLDWLISSYGGNRWWLYVNDGAGNFTFDQQFLAQNNPACAIFFDADNDGDLEITLLDEIGDIVRVMRNENVVAPGDMNCDGLVTPSDIAGFVLALISPAQYPLQFPECEIDNADINADGVVTPGDIAGFVALLTGG